MHRMPCIRSEIAMRIILLLSTMLLATVAQPCLAQSHDGAAAAAAVDVARQSATQAVPGTTAPKSPFGRVMAVLIAKLVQDSTQESQSRKAAGNDTSTLPIDIEVGAAFRPDAVVATNARDESGQAPSITASRDSGGTQASLSEPLALQAAAPAEGPR
jgi:hypothetical protein